MPRRVRLGWWLLAGLLFGSTAATSVLLIKEVEYQFFPVVTKFTIHHAQVDGDSLLIWGVFTKMRDCRFIEAVAMAGPVVLELEYPDTSKNRAISRATGLQLFGPWRLTPNLYPIRIVSRHSCHPLWDTTTTLVEGFRP